MLVDGVQPRRRRRSMKQADAGGRGIASGEENRYRGELGLARGWWRAARSRHAVQRLAEVGLEGVVDVLPVFFEGEEGGVLKSQLL